MTCQDCLDLGLLPAQHPRLLATVGEFITIVFCGCEVGQARRAEGGLQEVVMGALALAFFHCYICGGDGITSDGDFCSCPAGREKAAVSRNATRIRRGPAAKGGANAE